MGPQKLFQQVRWGGNVASYRGDSLDLHPGWLIGILIMAYCNPYILG